jgi:hypothetical protein
MVKMKKHHDIVRACVSRTRTGSIHYICFCLLDSKSWTLDVDKSTWTIEEDTIVIYLAKANKAQVWDVSLTGKLAAPLDPLSKQEVQKEMMLERFQAENPGFDFRNATFNGSVPDPRTFMDGVKYS